MLREEREACFLNMKMKCSFLKNLQRIRIIQKSKQSILAHFNTNTVSLHTNNQSLKICSAILLIILLVFLIFSQKQMVRHHGSVFIRQVLVENKNIFNVPNTFIIFSSLNFYVATISLGNGLLNSMILYLKVAFRIVWEKFPNGSVKNIIIIYNSLENN